MASTFLGLFTAEDIQKDQFIIKYTGRIVDSENFENLNDDVDYALIELRNKQGLCYGFQVQSNLTLEAFCLGNLTRFANHASV